MIEWIDDGGYVVNVFDVEKEMIMTTTQMVIV